MSGDVTGETTRVLSNTLVGEGPDTSATLNRQLSTIRFTEHPVFRTMSYNILADEYTRPECFPQCPPFALDFKYRVKLMINELVNFRADIICLQETDRKVFDCDLQPVLTHAGYEGEFRKKGGEVDEGLSMFYRKDRFAMLESRRMVHSDHLQEPRFSYLWEKISCNPDLVIRIVTCTSALHVVVLQCRQDKKKFLVVGNTHFYHKPDANHVRLLQVEMCLTELRLQRDELKSRFPESEVGVLLCGDFNSKPQSGVLKYCLEGKIDSDYADWSSAPGEEVKDLSLEHSFSLGSACGTPKYTNYTLDFKDCLDYIFYDKSAFEVDQMIPLPKEDELALNEALPNVSFPSDHISLVADLKWQ